MAGTSEPARGRSAGGSAVGERATDGGVPTDELVQLLGDEYTRRILSALGDDSVPAREVADATGVSRPTVYRRLNRLEAVGAVETTMTVHPEGQHRKAFRVVIDRIAVSLAGDSVDVEDPSESSTAEDAVASASATPPR